MSDIVFYTSLIVGVLILMCSGGMLLRPELPLGFYRLIAPETVAELEAEVRAERELDLHRERVERDWNWLVTTDLGVELDDTCPRCDGAGERRPDLFSLYDDRLVTCYDCGGLGWVLDTYPCRYLARRLGMVPVMGSRESRHRQPR